MSIEQAEQLKRELTDKWVVVAEDTPELRRFSRLTGRVKTVNMNCRALVEFDGPEDIGWYDIDPQFLTVVDGPRPKVEEEPEKTKPASEKKAAPAGGTAGGNPLDQIRAGAGGDAKPAAGGGSPLDKIRQQAGGEAGSVKPAGGSPLDQIRSQGGKSDAAESESATDESASAAKKDKPAPSGSPLDQIRSQGGFNG